MAPPLHILSPEDRAVHVLCCGLSSVFCMGCQTWVDSGARTEISVICCFGLSAMCMV